MSDLGQCINKIELIFEKILIIGCKNINNIRILCGLLKLS